MKPQYPPASVRNAVTDVPLPAVILDLRAVELNAADLVRRAGGMPIRVASKSLRIPQLIQHVLGLPGFHGVLAYSVAEAIYLVRAGITDDVVVAYPSVDRASISQVLDDEELRSAITFMVDSPQQVQLMLDAGAGSWDATSPARLCLDVDASWRPVRGLHIGTRRSPIHTVADVEHLIEQIFRAMDSAGSSGACRIVGVMMYEAHIAGVGDNAGGVRQPAIRLMQKLSAAELATRRGTIVAAVENQLGYPLEFVNGGGTGSVDSTAAETAVTEVAAGSGLIGPGLFDTYRSFQPWAAQWFALPITRIPAAGVVTVAGGGRIASGPAGADRLPQPVYPPGLEYLPDEGPGEVQTPLRVSGRTDRLYIGDPVWFRHAKAGELAEHASEVIVIEGTSSNASITAHWATYRGLGHAFV